MGKFAGIYVTAPSLPKKAGRAINEMRWAVVRSGLEFAIVAIGAGSERFIVAGLFCARRISYSLIHENDIGVLGVGLFS